MSEIRRFARVVRDAAKKGLTSPKIPAELVDFAQKLAANNKIEKAWVELDTGINRYPRNAEIISAMKKIPNHYDDSFYEVQRAGSLNSARQILQILYTIYPFRSMVDFGAGVGTWLRVAADYGAEELIAIEGDWVKNNVNRFTQATYIYTDLNLPLKIERRFDLAISVEVAEHINPDRSQGFVDDICRSSDIVIFGAALPRQHGSGHINGRPHCFWINLFAKQGYICLDLFRPKVWNDRSVEPWYAQNTFLFVSDEARDKFASVPRAALVDVYHPLMMNELVKADAKAGISDPTSPSD